MSLARRSTPSWLTLLGCLALLCCRQPIAHATSNALEECPEFCKCKWVSGKQAALCNDESITEIPRGLGPDYQLLNISNGVLGRIGDGEFREADLLNLQRIYLRKCRLTDLSPSAFHGLVLLVEVDLADNEISDLHPDTFTGCARLKSLILSGNPLGRLRSEQFPELQHLRFLELRSCRLTHIHPDAFVRVSLLETLDLRGNHITMLAAATFAPLARLATLSLENNPWKCDCRLRALRDWYLAGRLAHEPLYCHEPVTLKSRKWRDIPSKEFACTPKIHRNEYSTVRAQPGANVTLACRVEGDPEPKVTWYFAGNDTLPPLAIIEAEEGLLDKWVNVTIVNATDTDSGEYTCVADNVAGQAHHVVVLMMAEVSSQAASHPREAPLWMSWIILAISAGGLTTILLFSLICAISFAHRKEKRCSSVKNSASFSEQDKKLLDASVSTTEPMSNAQSLEMIEPILPNDQFPPPPPEFSAGILPVGAYGNIFISVSVSPDPGVDPQGYPDLLDIPRSPAGTEILTLPRRRMPPINICIDASAVAGQYDSVGPRVTAGGGSPLPPLVEVPEELLESGCSSPTPPPLPVRSRMSPLEYTTGL